ncbi:glycosyl hydrolase family 8 [Streptacidiphilus sp. N1-3]|uniref:Glycosyl hydrolase family 8 n=1 Tax=Streptacidiphilus alkalitolerans TaxID=3342712 RepID=A0ABV6WWK7_9ACTN
MAKRLTRAIAGVAALATATLGFVAVEGPTASAATTAFPFPTHVTYKVGVLPTASQASRDAAVEKEYDSWKATYLVKGCASNEYYVSTKGDGDSPNNGPVSEGQGYGMNIVPLMAGYDAAAQTEFNGLWQLVKDHEDADGLMQWTLDGKTCKYADSGTPDAATDGDLDIGYGLILADKQWGGYTADAKTWLANFYAHDVASDGHLKTEDDDSYADDSRPSDYMVDHLRAFAAYDTAHDWNKVVDKTESLITEFTAGYSATGGLMSDFIRNANTTSPKPAAANFQEDQPDNIVGYNSIRVPWHLGTDALLYGSSTASASYATAKKESACLKGESGGNPQKVYPHTKLDCTPYSTSDQAEEAGDSVGPAAMAAGDQAWTDAIWNQLATNPFGDGYFGETIKTLVYIVMAGDYWNPTDSSAPPTTTPPTTTPPTTTPPTTAPPTTTPPTTTPPTGGNVSYEAEAATLAGGTTITSCAHCSGGKKLSYLGNGGTATFTGITEPAAGSYTLTIYFMSVGQARSAVVTANGVNQTVSFPETPDYNTVVTKTITVQLNAGNTNTIEFSNPSAGAPNLDRIVV